MKHFPHARGPARLAGLQDQLTESKPATMSDVAPRELFFLCFVLTTNGIALGLIAGAWLALP